MALEFKLLALLFNARKRQQVFGEPRQTLGIVADDPQKPHVVIGIVQCPVHQSFGVSLDGGQRRTQLVRHVDHEVFSHALHLFQLGVLALKLGHGLLKVFGGIVQGLGELAEFTRIGVR